MFEAPPPPPPVAVVVELPACTEGQYAFLRDGSPACRCDKPNHIIYPPEARTLEEIDTCAAPANGTLGLIVGAVIGALLF